MLISSASGAAALLFYASSSNQTWHFSSILCCVSAPTSKYFIQNSLQSVEGISFGRNILGIWHLLSTWSLMPDLHSTNQWENRDFSFLWSCFYNSGENLSKITFSLVKTAIIPGPFREFTLFGGFFHSWHLLFQKKDDVRVEVAGKSWWCLNHLSCLEQRLLLGEAVPLVGLGPCRSHKRMSEILWELWKEAALGDNTVLISTTKNRALQAFFFFFHALMTLLLTGSSNSEKLRGLFSISVFFLLHCFSLACFSPILMFYLLNMLNPSPVLRMISLTLPFCMPAQIGIF